MATQTLLSMVQNILSSMSSDEVNSIGDTVESMQVAQIIQNKYYDIVARGDLTLDNVLFQLNPSDNSSMPVLMTLPAGVSRMDWIKYYNTNPQDNTQNSQFGSFSHSLNTDLVSTVNWTVTSTTSVTIVTTGNVTFTVQSGAPIQIGQLAQANATAGNSLIGRVVSYSGTTLVLAVTNRTGSGTFASWSISSITVPNVPPGYSYVQIVPLDYFLDVTDRLDITQNNVQSYSFSQGGNKFTFRYFIDRQPRMCTVISNNWVIFDSFDNTQDDTLQASKTEVFGQIVPPFVLQDNFVPTLDDQQFPLLLNESKSLAFYELKQMTHAKADQEIQRQWTVTQKTKSISNKPTYFEQVDNYGRVPRTGIASGYPLWRWMRYGN
jgi:hypothetical protein